MSNRARKLRRQVLRGLGGVDRFSLRSCQVAVAAMAIFVLAQVLFRYVFRTAFMWTEEASIFLMIWMTFVGAGVAIRRRAHVAMTFFVEKLPNRLSRWLFVLSSLAILGFLAIVAWKGWFLSISAEAHSSPALGVPMFWPYLIIPIGMILMICQVVAAMLETGTGGNSSEKGLD